MNELELKQKEYNNCINNVEVYKKYKMFAYDWLFYYAIQVLFLTTIKEFTVSQIMFLSSVYAFAACACQLIVGLIVNKLNNRKSIIIGNIILSFLCLMYIISVSYNVFLVIQVLFAFGSGLKSVAEGNILYGSLKRIEKRDRFSKIEGMANSRYYYLDAITGIIAGYLFIINGYIPIVLCFICNIIALIMSISFRDYIPSNASINENGEYENEKTSFKDYLSSFKTIINSDRAKAILVFSFIFYGIIATGLILYKSILIDLNMSAQYIAIIASIHSIIVGIGSKSLYYIEKKTKNKTLTIFGITFVIGIYIIGFVGSFNILNVYSMTVICFCLFLMAIIQGAYRVVIKKYVVSFTTGKIRTNIVSIYYMAEGIGQGILLFFSGLLLKNNSNARTAMIMGILGLAIILLILIYIDNKLGLKPEEYAPKDIYKEKEEV